jgi:outer membrane lipoprotein SlyB
MHKTIILGLIIIAGLFTSCETKTQTGALAGAGIGATAGALISHDAGGALIGGALGAAGGALIGSALDAQDRRIMQQQSPHALGQIDNGQPLSMQDIKDMSAAGISDNVIISQIRATNSVYRLSSGDIISLKNAGVSQRVINAMIQTGNY